MQAFAFVAVLAAAVYLLLLGVSAFVQPTRMMPST